MRDTNRKVVVTTWASFGLALLMLGAAFAFDDFTDASTADSTKWLFTIGFLAVTATSLWATTRDTASPAPLRFAVGVLGSIPYILLVGGFWIDSPQVMRTVLIVGAAALAVSGGSLVRGHRQEGSQLYDDPCAAEARQVGNQPW